MPTTYPGIPAVIVGDTETLQWRRDDMDRDASILACCAGERLANSGDLGDYFTGELIAHGAAWPALSGELARRRAAKRMSHAIQPDEGIWR